MKLIVLAIAALGFIYLLVYRPEYIAVLLFALVIGDINLDLGGLPLNSRAIVCLSLFGRVLVEKAKEGYPSFLSTRYAFYIFAFLLYSLLVSWANDLMDFTMFKEFLLTFICAYCGYYFFVKNGNYELFKTSLILAGLSCLADLVYTYAHAGTFPVQRIIGVLTRQEIYANHNYFGFICAVCFVFLLQDFLNNRSSGKITLVLLLVMFLSVLMSTSRSALLLLFIFAIPIIARSFKSKGNSKKIYNLIGVSVGCVFLCLFLFESLHSLFDIDSDFIDKIGSRLIDEPLAVLNKNLGYNYNVQSLDSMEWREEASSIAYNAFMSLSLKDQFFGLGYGSFLLRDFGHGYDAHNGFLRIMIETGIIGLVIYFSLIFVITWQVIKQKFYSPLYVALVFFILYTISHNNEMIAAPAFLLIGTLAGEIEFLSANRTVISDQNELLLS